MSTMMRRLLPLALLTPLVSLAISPSAALAQSGISDDRVSLPDGPGSIGGVGENVEVNPNMGSASFSVPISVPQGESAALTPQISLSYSSGAGMGNLGIGWELSNQTIERTVDRGLPTYTTSDRFAANGGSDLVYVGDVDGTRAYRARFEGGFVRYRWHNAGAGLSGYWTAEYPDGRIGYYGADEDGTLVPSSRVQADTGETFRYHLVALVDVSGRKLVQRFTKQDGWVLLDEIQWGFGDETTPRFSLRFSYEARPDVISNATPGYEIRLTQRLSDIRVMSASAMIHRYALAYEMGAASGGMSRLASVQEFGRDGGLLPIAHTFSYSRTLGGACEVGCEQPFMVDMGTLPGGVSLATGRAQLIDINGDALPDLVASNESGEHTFYTSALSASGNPSFGAPVASAQTVGGSSLILGDNGVQLFDVNGDGFSDIVNQRSGEVLCNNGSGDWSGSGCTMNATSLPNLDDDADSDVNPEGMRFFDFDNDKLIDLLVTGSDSAAQVYRNTGTGYVAQVVQALGDTFDASSNLQLADMNGDGLLDPVRIVPSGSGTIVSYRVNLGFGRWTDFSDISLADLPSGSADSATLEDLNGDGLDDIVVVAGTDIRYWLNRNGERFDAGATLSSADVDGDIPERTGSETVLFADMNGNGTDDIVWVADSGAVRFLELFPVRPNLLSRVENGLGFVRIIEYGTAVAQRARDAGTAEEWENPLPNAMNVVTATDTWVSLTGGEGTSGIHERSELIYHDGYYDGAEKSFRGYERVERRLVSDAASDGQEPGVQLLEYDVGRDDVYRNGLLVRQVNYGDAAASVMLNEIRSTYSDCPLSDVDGAATPIRFTCETSTTVINMEGRPAAEWITLQSDKTYDGYGNIVEQHDHGVVNMNAPESAASCGACDAPAGLSGGACGSDCLGDERITRSTFIAPGAGTSDAWLLRLKSREVVLGVEGGLTSETQLFYDGPDFMGLASGQATRGLLTRSTRRLSDSESIPATRSAYDAGGRLIATLDPNGEVSDTSGHRRDFEYDARGLRVTRIRIAAGDYELVQDIAYDASFMKPSESTDFRVVRGGSDLTPRNASSFRYDEFGRIIAIIRPGDSESAPTETFEYQLGDPVTRIIARARRMVGGPMDVENILCRDGLDRIVQTRRRVGEGRYQIDGFVSRNSRGKNVRVYLPYSSTSADCEMAPPSGVAFTALRYDSLGRVVESTLPDASIHGSATSRRTEYGPLTTTQWDANDTDSSSAHANTPTRTTIDGLTQVVSIERQLTPTQSATYRIYYDGLGRTAQVVDPEGNVRIQTFDLAGRVLSATDPNSGQTTFARDTAGNVTTQTDARGLTRQTAYDALNRVVRRWDGADMAGTLEETTYDLDADCTDCRNGAGRIVGLSYPLPTHSAPATDAFGYDPRGRRVLLRRVLEGNSFETGYGWDGAGSLISATYPDGQTLTYGYDEASRPVSIEGVIDSTTYNDEGRLSAINHHNGAIDSFEYDALQRVSGLSSMAVGGLIADLTITRDRAANVTAIADAVSSDTHPSHTAAYTYDAWYRVTEARLGNEGSEETLTAAYDLLDNIMSRTSSLGVASPAHVGDYAYAGAGPNAATQVGGTAYTYDAAGQVQERGNLQLIWDHLGRLVQATPEGERTSEFAYSPTGERVLKSEHGGVTYYAAPDFVVRDGIASLYPRLQSRRVARLRSDMATRVLPDANGDDQIDIADAWLGRDNGEQQRMRLLRSSARRLLHAATDNDAHLHANLQGSIIASTDSEGALIAERGFYPFGLERGATGYVDEHSFTGQERDETTGLYAFRARYLDPLAGRWTAVDPLFGILDGSNVALLGESTTGYAYVANNPINTIDPTGLKGKKLSRRIGRAFRRLRKGIGNRLGAIARSIFPYRKQGKASQRTRDAAREPKLARRAAEARLNQIDHSIANLGESLNSGDGTSGLGGRAETEAGFNAALAERGPANTALQEASANPALAQKERSSQRADAHRGATLIAIGAAVAGAIVGIAVAAGSSLEEPEEDGAPRPNSPFGT